MNPNDLIANSFQKPLNAGNVYYVMQSAQAVALRDDFEAEHDGVYADGTAVVHSTIQSALDACTADRNDYVVVMPDADDYDITAALTLTKKGVHLIAAGGQSNGGYGSTNAVRIHQNTAATAVMTISGQAVEVAGFFLKGVADTNVIEISASAHCCNIHDNFVAMATTSGSATAYGIHGTGESTNLLIHHNDVEIYSPTASQTVGGGILLANGTRARINDNIINAGGFAQTMTVGISVGSGAMSMVKDNVFLAPASGSPASSTITTPIVLNASSVAVDNRIAIAGSTGEMITTGTSGADSVGNLGTTKPNAPMIPPGAGNVYWVCETTQAMYADFLAERQQVYSDGSSAVQTTIQGALDACVADRNDYVFILPQGTDYDITAALTMTKKGVHLIGCGGSLGDDTPGSTNAVRIHQETASTACITLSAAACEIAGIFFKVATSTQAITLTSGSAYCMNIHNNSFPLVVSGATNAAAIVGTGDAGAWGMIHHNHCFSYSGGSATSAVAFADIAASATMARVSYNEVVIGDGNTATLCISNQAVKGFTNYNTFSAADGTITDCISIGTSGAAIGNLAAVATQLVVTGGTVDRSFVQNYAGLNGGTVQDNDT